MLGIVFDVLFDVFLDVFLDVLFDVWFDIEAKGSLDSRPAGSFDWSFDWSSDDSSCRAAAFLPFCFLGILLSETRFKTRTSTDLESLTWLSNSAGHRLTWTAVYTPNFTVCKQTANNQNPSK